MKRLLLLLMTAVLILPLSAQKKKDTSVVPAYQMKMEYGLPKTQFKVELELEEVHNVPGIFMQYAESSLGKQPTIKNESSVWSLKSVKVTPISVPDMSCRYTLVASEENEMLELAVTPEGFLAGVGTSPKIKTEKGKAVSAKMADSYKKALPIIGLGTYNFLEYKVDSVFTETKGPKNVITKHFDPNSPSRYEVKNNDQMVREILDKIYDLRVDRNDVISGDREVQNGVIMQTILKEYDELEQEYLSLFLGSSQVIKHNCVFVVDPQNVKDKQLAFRLSNSAGLVSAKDVNSQAYMFTYSNILQPSAEVAVPTEMDLAYRVPTTANVALTIDEKEILSFNAIIPQWGVIQKFTPSEMKRLLLEFYPQYGSLKSAVLRMVKE